MLLFDLQSELESVSDKIKEANTMKRSICILTVFLWQEEGERGDLGSEAAEVVPGGQGVESGAGDPGDPGRDAPAEDQGAGSETRAQRGMVTFVTSIIR